MPQRQGHENAVNFTISLCLVFTICVGLLRLWIRRNAYGIDDTVIAAATLVSLGHTGASYAALAAGLGKPWSAISTGHDLAKLHQASMASVVLFFIALYLSKCAMIAFLSRITKTSSQIKLYYICNGVVATLGILSVIIVTAGCPTSPSSGYYWAFSQNNCPYQGARWQAVTGFDGASEILLLILPVHLLWHLQMRFSKKAMIIAAFWVRLPVLGLSIGRNLHTLQLRRERSDAGLDSALVVIWLQIELAYAIAASTLSAIKTFTESFNTGFGVGQLRGKGDDSYGMSGVSGSSGRNGRVEMGPAATNTTGHGVNACPITPRGEKERTALDALAGNTDDELRLRPETELKSVTNISAEPAHGESFMWRAGSSVGSESSGEDTMVILRETAYEVQLHDRAPMLPEVVRRT